MKNARLPLCWSDTELYNLFWTHKNCVSELIANETQERKCMSVTRVHKTLREHKAEQHVTRDGQPSTIW